MLTCTRAVPEFLYSLYTQPYYKGNRKGGKVIPVSNTVPNKIEVHYYHSSARTSLHYAHRCAKLDVHIILMIFVINRDTSYQEMSDSDPLLVRSRVCMCIDRRVNSSPWANRRKWVGQKVLEIQGWFMYVCICIAL